MEVRSKMNKHQLMEKIRTTLGVSNVQKLITRFAPSPTGYLHLGHVASAIFVWGVARKFDAKIILRIEDHDRQRSKQHFEESILADLRILGFLPTNAAGSHGYNEDVEFSRQTDHLDRYNAALEVLRQHAHIYACACTRNEIFALRQNSLEMWYSGTCRHLGRAEGVGRALRLEIDDSPESFDDLWLGHQVQIPSRQCGDFPLKDKAGNWTYQFAVVVDDEAEGVNLVIRGQDLVDSTGRQMKLRRHLGAMNMPYFLHHPLVMEDDGTTKLSKRIASLSIKQRLADGQSVEEILGEAAWSVGLTDAKLPLSQADLVYLFA